MRTRRSAPNSAVAVLALLLVTANAAESPGTATELHDPSASIERCVMDRLRGLKYGDAWSVANRDCAAEKAAWIRACHAKANPRPHSGFAFDDGGRCHQELRYAMRDLDRAVEAERPEEPSTPTPQSRAMSAALADLRAGKPLPGLPRLDKPVYVKRGSIVCTSHGALGNPNVQTLLLTGTCQALETTRRVSVILPHDSQEYLQNHFYGTVRVVWRAEAQSVANVGSGWVRSSELKN